MRPEIDTPDFFIDGSELMQWVWAIILVSIFILIACETFKEEIYELVGRQKEQNNGK